MQKKFIALKPFNNKVFYKNAVLDEHSGVGSPYLIAAKKLLAEKNIVMNTIDLDPTTPTLKDVYMDVPYPWELRLWLRIIRNRKKNILFMPEPPLVNPFNYMKIFHYFFSKIYTWNDSLVDNIKYFKYFIIKKTKGIETKKVSFKNKKLLILMNSNLSPFLPFRLLSLSTMEFYSERIKAANFFDKYYPTEFSIYGRGWNKPRKFSIMQRLFGYKEYKTYKGNFPHKDKYKILSEYKFCICFENSEVSGYLEKITDYLKGGCVPVYLGAPNVTDYINEKCFIDFRKFKNYEELATFLETMDDQTYNKYTEEIKKFLASKEFRKRWSIDSFCKLFLKSIYSIY